VSLVIIWFEVLKCAYTNGIGSVAHGEQRKRASLVLRVRFVDGLLRVKKA